MIALSSRGRLLTFALAALSAGCSGGSDESESEPKPVVAVQTAVVEAQLFTESIGAIGSVAGRPGHVASLGAPTATRVSNVYVSEGTRVTSGQRLVELDRTAIDAAEQAYERAERLNREGVAPRKDVEQAASDVAKARSEAVTARRAAQLSVLRSPIAGVVTRLTAVLGASVDVNQTLVEVADPSALDIVFTVTPTEAGRVKPNASVTLFAGQRAGGEPLGSGKVSQVG